MPEINYQLLRYQSENIPHFDGNPKLLSRFITAVENLLIAFQDRANVNATINTCLFDTILSKLKGRAAELVVSRSELKTWALIKDVLITSFADQRSIDCLIQDLLNLKPFKNENPLLFGMRIQDSRSLLFSKLNAEADDAATKLIKIKHYDEFALKTFLNGLPYNLQLVTRLKNPDCLEKAMAFVREEENFILYRNAQNTNFKQPMFLNKNNKPNNVTQTYKPPQMQNQNTYRPMYYPMQNAPQNNNPYRPFLNYPQQMAFKNPFSNFPQQNNNFTQPRPNFGNNQSFGRPWYNNQNNNQYRGPNPQFSQNQNFGQTSRRSKVEPMDTSSGNTILNNALTDKDQKITTQELYNQEVLQRSPDQANQLNQSDNFSNDNNLYNHENNEYTDCYNYDENQSQDQYDFDLNLGYSDNSDTLLNTDYENQNFTLMSQKTDMT